MPPPADAAPDLAALGNAGSVIAAVVGIVLLCLYVADKVTDTRTKRRTGAAAAEKAEAEAAATPIAQWREIVGDLRAEQGQLRAKMGELEAANHECEERARQHQAEIEDIRRQNAGQQRQLDVVEGKVGRIKTALSLPPADGSGPHPALPPTTPGA